MSGSPGSEPSPSGSDGSKAPSAAPAAAKTAAKSEGNPALRMLGLPRWRPRLPSRNWMIFLGVTGSFTAAIMYDRQQKRKVMQKWQDTVSHLATEPLGTNKMPRRVRVFVQAPPGDGLMPAREEFYEYIKPILVAGAMDWEVVESRREGDVRWAVAEDARKKRRKAGEGTPTEEEDIVSMARERGGTTDEGGVRGDLVMGRHAWKEYIRGLHEGWLGPVDKPPEAAEEPQAEPVEKGPDGHSHTTITDAAVEILKDVIDKGTEEPAEQDAKPAEPTEEEKKKQEEKEAEEKRKKLYKPDPYNSISDYASALAPSSLPEHFEPVAVIPFPHILGFLNTPIRVWRYLHKRDLADQIGRRTAALVLASSYRSMDAQAEPSSVDESQGRTYEQQKLLANEESEWYKKVRKREREEGKEDVLLDPIVLDERIAERMRVFELSGEDEARAAQFLARPREKDAPEEVSD